MFEHDTTGVNESGDFTPIPEGTYTLRIDKIEGIKQSQKGYPQVVVWLVVDEGEYSGRRIRHMVTFIPRNKDGAGIAKRWLHAIGEEYEGKFMVNPRAWGGTVKCDVIIDDSGKYNNISAVHLPDVVHLPDAVHLPDTEVSNRTSEPDTF
jgi:hypothetical protein